jgi:hypothetical protein
MLLVDEISKSKSEARVLEMTSGVLNVPGRLADGRKYVVLPLFTSLSEILLKKASVGSIIQVPLSVPLKSAPAVMKAKLNLGSQFDSLIDVLCNDVGNHGRMLETIVRCLQVPPVDHAVLTSSTCSVDENVRHLVLAHSFNPLLALSTCHSRMVTHSTSLEFFRNLRNADLMNAVCISLLGLPVRRDQQIKTPYRPVVLGSLPIAGPGPEAVATQDLSACVGTYDELQALGVFIGDAGTVEGLMIPVMSPLQLLQWAGFNLEACSDPQMRLFFDSVVQAFTVVNEGTWKTFERFHLSTAFCSRSLRVYSKYMC